MSTIPICLSMLSFLAMTHGAEAANDPPATPATQNAARHDEAGSAQGAKDKDPTTIKKHRGKFTIGRETTYITSPLDADGYIDDAAALNEHLRQGVTPANNAAVLLWKALGPHPRGQPMPAEFFAWLGIEPPPEAGVYFIDESQFVKEHLKIDPRKQPKEAKEVSKQFERVTQQPWMARDYPNQALWLKRNEKPLALVVEATRRAHYFSPVVPDKTQRGVGDLLGARLSGVQQYRGCANALVARALFRADAGAFDDGWQDLQACHRLGRLAGHGGTLIEALVGMAIEQLACKADLVFLERTHPDAQQIRSCLRDLQKLPPLPGIAKIVQFGERFVMLDTFKMIDRLGMQYVEMLNGGELDRPNVIGDRLLQDIDWNPAFKTANRWCDRWVDALSEKERGTRQKKVDQIEADLKTLKAKSIDPDAGLGQLLFGDKQGKSEALGDILVTMLLPAIGKVQAAADRAQQTHDNLLVAFALAWYERAHGSYPNTLDRLTPGYLKQVPQDSFSGQALLYRSGTKGYLLYSVGPNGKDDGGRGREDQPPGDDLSVRMPMLEGKAK
jgi:hypothetical protein